MKSSILQIVAILSLVGLPLSAAADERNTHALPSVLELYTSQSCAMCPKANRQFSEFAQKNDVIALTFPVGYWDYLGWKDTFAQQVFDDRQKDYNTTMNRRGPYTPQVIFNGSDHCSATRARSMAKELDKSSLDKPMARIAYDGQSATIQPIAPRRDGAVKDDVWLVEFLPGETFATPKSGSNSGKEMVYFNRVTKLHRLGDWTGAATMFDAPCPSACAVLVQRSGPGEIHAAAMFLPS